MSTLHALPFVAVLLGLSGSVHCVAMCGGIAAAVGTTLPGATPAARAWHALVFNGGRVLGYASIGALAGAIGAGLDGVAAAVGAAALGRWFAAGLIALVGLRLLTERDWLGLERAGSVVWRQVRRLAQPMMRWPASLRLAGLGMLWGWLPCGLVYSALALALASGSAPAGAVTLAAFGAATWPAMVAITLAGVTIARALGSRQARSTLGVLLLALAAVTALGAGLPAWHAPGPAASGSHGPH